MIKRPKLYLSISLLSVALLALLWFFSVSEINPANTALAEYQIEKMTCGSCVGNIEKALSKLDGVGSVEVNLTSNRGRVTYDPNEIDSTLIAETITASGYPARLRLELDPSAYTALQQEQSQLGQEYLAKIGDRLLARKDFEQLLKQRSGGTVTEPNDQLWQSVWTDVLERELLLSAAEQNQIVVQDGEVDARLDELRQAHKGLEQMVTERYGNMNNFRQRLREDLIINRNIDDQVYAGVTSPGQRQARFQEWYAELQKNTEVIIFDSRLKTLGSVSSGCACCNS